ncbi:MAG: FIST signal transduction protein [Actinomycetes bacterium]
MRRFGDGLATGPDLVGASHEATARALDPLEGVPPDLVAVFVCGGEADEIAAAAEAVTERSGARHVIGCTAGGVIGDSRGVEDERGVSVWAGVLPGVRLRAFHLETFRTDDSLAVLGMPDPMPDDAVGVLLADPYSFPADSFVERSNEVMPGLTFVGGLADGPHGSGSTRLFSDGTTHERGAVGVLLGGLEDAGVSVWPLVSQGCRPVGPSMVVTRSDGNVLQELAGVPAYRKLEEVVAELPPEDQDLVTHGLHVGIAMDEYADEHEHGDFLIRGVLGGDPDVGALAVGDVVEVGRTVRFQVRDAQAAEADLAGTLARFRGRAARVEGALLVSCNGRGSTLFPTADHDVQAVRKGLGTGGVAGFFAAGEIGPVGGRNHLHGFTASMLAFGAAGPAFGEAGANGGPGADGGLGADGGSGADGGGHRG